ncbi:hypothetical protein B484DRAFT_439431, partial [Ochromonadaceae sp. CCMP2298]
RCPVRWQRIGCEEVAGGELLDEGAWSEEDQGEPGGDAVDGVHPDGGSRVHRQGCHPLQRRQAGGVLGLQHWAGDPVVDPPQCCSGRLAVAVIGVAGGGRSQVGENGRALHRGMLWDKSAGQEQEAQALSNTTNHTNTTNTTNHNYSTNNSKTNSNVNSNIASESHSRSSSTESATFDALPIPRTLVSTRSALSVLLAADGEQAGGRAGSRGVVAVYPLLTRSGTSRSVTQQEGDQGNQGPSDLLGPPSPTQTNGTKATYTHAEHDNWEGSYHSSEGSLGSRLSVGSYHSHSSLGAEAGAGAGV